jgi:hypothetical protein
LDDVQHPLGIVLSDNLDEPGEEDFSHYNYKGKKALDKDGKIIDTDKGWVEFILNRKE